MQHVRYVVVGLGYFSKWRRFTQGPVLCNLHLKADSGILAVNSPQ